MNDRFDVKDFLQAPGDKCPRCWLMSRHCCCAGLPESAPRSSIEAFLLGNSMKLQAKSCLLMLPKAGWALGSGGF